MLARVTTALILRYIGGCFGFALLGVLVIGDPYDKVLSSLINKIGILLIPKPLLMIQVHRLNSFSRYRLNICYRMRSVLYPRCLVFAKV